MWWCYLHLWWYFLKGRVRARSDVRFQSWAKLALGCGEGVHSLKNSAMTVKGVCRLCTNCLSTPKKSGKYPNQPLSYAFLVKIIMPGGLTVQKPAAGWETFSTVTKFFLLGPANLGIENFSLKRDNSYTVHKLIVMYDKRRQPELKMKREHFMYSNRSVTVSPAMASCCCCNISQCLSQI